MSVSPIPSHVVHTIFQYILPPALPIPPHLLSKRLVERHHFLSVSPTDPASYLCWPSSYTDQITEALERAAPDPLTSEPEHEVRYSSPDQETFLAHVRPHAASSLQIVFSWDSLSETWRYHDARLLPFPREARPSLDDVLVGSSGPVGLGLHWREADSPVRSSSPTADNYWAGYDSSDSSPATPPVPINVITEEEDKAEAAYWASYSAVQGSGDSTVPSPAPDKARCAQKQQSDLCIPDSPFDPLVEHLHLRLQDHTDGLLSPRFLSPRLERPNPSEQSADPEAASAPGLDDQEEEEEIDYEFPRVSDLKMIGPSVSDMTCENGMCLLDATAGSSNGGDDEGAKEAVRGIYRMWKTQRRDTDGGTAEFLDIVKAAIEAP